ncbi:MAG: SsgA family sporulation/cell division regulator [Mycobacteriales bacterium]
MSTSPTTVTADLGLRLVLPDSPSLPVLATLRYEASDPYAICVTFHTGADGSAVEWSFARQLLTDGSSQPVGEGDVRVWPTNRYGRHLICLSLTSPSGSALFETSLPEVVEFLTRSYAAVPSGSESDYVDIDAELSLLLWDDCA